MKPWSDMKNSLKIVAINFLVLCGLLIAPALLFAVYKHVKLSQAPLRPSEDLRINPAYPTRLDQQKAKALSLDVENGFGDYQSFIGWRRNPFEGNYKNVLPDYNNRLSTNSSISQSSWFFGGSTMWGTGAVDSETIPSWYASMSNSEVLNLGESAWVSRQSVNQLMNLFGDGHRPRLVVFYDGVNDVLHGCRSEHKNVPAHIQESAIASKLKQKPHDVLMQSLVPLWNFVTAPYKALGAKIGFKVSKHQSYGSMDCSSDPGKADRIASHLINNWYSAYLLARAHGAQFIGILQPQVFSSSIRSDYLHPGDLYMESEYLAVYPIIKQKMKVACAIDPVFCNHLVDGTTWLDGVDPVYIDFCHLTGSGNKIIAKNILQLDALASFD